MREKRIMKADRFARISLLVIAVAYVVWAGIHTYRSSYIAIDGERYFGLFDDAMISMRYAWNFAHGEGLVWNPGERVEGYTNLLMTLVMSVAAVFFEKRYAVLAVQIFGIPTMLGIAYLTWRLAEIAGEHRPYAGLTGILAAAGVLLYYPLNFWTLMGMETGLLAVFVSACAFFGVRWIASDRPLDLCGMAVAAGLAFLTRNDSLLLTGTIIAYIGIANSEVRTNPRRLRELFNAILGIAIFVAAQAVFRYAYYGELVPNTYTLKLTRFPLYIRLIGGARFVLDFLRESWLIFALAGAGLLLGFRRLDILLFAPMLAAIAYQVYVGGEPWDLWRMPSPAMPAMLILAAHGAASLVAHGERFLTSRALSGMLIGLLTLGALGIADSRFLPRMLRLGPVAEVRANRSHTNAAIAIDAMTLPGASVGVIWAGTLPYYVDRYALDYLGKSDPYIAGLDADISGDAGWGAMISVPGHNKYDLEYSIVERKPTFSQVYAWGYATVKPYFVRSYVRVEYHGAVGDRSIFLLKDSPLVCWESCKDQYEIIPWPKWEINEP
jgi:hypothetical protein